MTMETPMTKPVLRRARRALMIAMTVLAAPFAAATAHAEPALWKVQAPQATIYLFGTVHVLKPGVVWRSAAIDSAIKAADTLWLEVPNADDQAVMQPLVMKYGIDPAHPLSTRLDAPTKARFDAFLATLGVAPAQMDPLRPWMAGMAVSLLPLMKAGYDPNSGVEHVLKAEMKGAGKAVDGFETAEQQVHYLADIPSTQELEFFKQSLEDGEKSLTIVNDLVAAWSAGDEAKLETLLNGEMRDKYPDLYQRLLVERNRRFAQRIAELAKGKGVLFVAVGAGHLVGADSVQADLQKLGLTAVRQ
jgi:uncharacterized protein YbaP (TraB family)